jgi:hypothetical protein
MVEKKNSIENLLVEVELYFKKELKFRNEMKELLSASLSNGMTSQINEIIFLGKFLHHVSNIMKRIGLNGEGYEKISQEFILNQNFSGNRRTVLKISWAFVPI